MSVGRDVGIRGPDLAESVRGELERRVTTFPPAELEAASVQVARRYRAGGRRWIVQRNRDIADPRVPYIYTVQRSHEAEVDAFECFDERLAHAVRDALNGLEDAAGPSSDQADGAR